MTETRYEDEDVVFKNPTSSQGKILRAAAKEFAARGFEGARMDSIANLAQLNKALVYRHFKTKKNLFQKALRYKFAGRYRVANKVPKALARALEYWFRHAADDPVFMRLLHQEALDREGNIIDESLRIDYYKERLADMKSRQANGQIDKGFDERMMLLALSALVVFPSSFPQMTQLITGLSPTDEKFKKEWVRFMRKLSKRLAPVKASG